MQATFEIPSQTATSTTTDVNRVYLEAFQQRKYPNVTTDKKQQLSYNNYRSTMQNFFRYIDKDIASIKREDIENFLANTKNNKNKAANIKCFLSFIIAENVNQCRFKIGKGVLFKLLEM